MRREEIEIKADNVNAAAGEILGVMEDTSKASVMYFEGWNGLGASAALRVVVQRLESGSAGPGLKFDKVIHVDCSVWKSRRALQKTIAEELQLPRRVMAIFDQRDEEDDFQGVDEGSRLEIPDVTREIFTNLSGHRFVVVFHNGYRSYIDLIDFGVPVHGYLLNRVLWTDQGRFAPSYILSHGKFEELIGNTGVFIHGTPKEDSSTLWGLVHEEAEEIAKYYTGAAAGNIIDHRLVEECVLYMWALRGMEDIIDWGTHSSNYWVCDGIIQCGDTHTSAWEIGDALQRYVRLDWNWKYMDRAVPFSATHLQHDHEPPRQAPFFLTASSSSNSLSPGVTSFFLAPTPFEVKLPAGMFQQMTRLRVLYLSRCTFSFASPPFLSCSDLRFLLLDHCKDDEGHVQTHSQSASCFRKLWVLDLSYTDWYWLLSEEMMSVMADLRELNVKGIKHWSISDLRGSCRLLNLVKLLVTAEPTDEAEASEATDEAEASLEATDEAEASLEATDEAEASLEPTDEVEAFPNLSSASSLKTVILDGCVGLQQVALTEGKQISSISFRGCARLNSLLLRGLFGSVEELDISGTAVKTLDLRALQAPGLKRLLLSGCEKLRAILWPLDEDINAGKLEPRSMPIRRPFGDDPEGLTVMREYARELELLRIDTTSRSALADGGEENLAATAAAGSSSVPHGARLQVKKEESFNKWRISLTDARLLRSLLPVKGYIERADACHVDIYAAAAVGGSIAHPQTSTPMVDSKYGDVFEKAAPANNNYVDVAAVPVTMMTWDCPEMPLPSSSDKSCIIELITQGQGSSKLLEGAPQSDSTSTSGLLLPDFVCNGATSLHVYDNSSITSVPAPPEGARWLRLRWCRVERCPKVHTVFATPQHSDVLVFWWLSTFWASQLPTARYVWNWPSTAVMSQISFQDLRFLHLDCCPRLIHVLPLPTGVDTLPSLETLEIVCCGDLREVFPLDPQRQERGTAIEFPNLRRIHLHELPMLQRICGHRMSAPRLETVNIRDCWSLSRLPTIGDTEPPPTVDCEKEWWDSLEWDGVEAKHHPSLYRPSHSRYYKKTQLPKGSILR